MSVLLHGTPVEVIDFHTHAFPEKIAANALGKLAAIFGGEPVTDGTVGGILAEMEACQVDRSVILNIATRPGQESSINRHAKEIADQYGDRLTVFGSVHFQSENALDELREIKHLGLPGIKLHPEYQGFEIDDERLFPIYQACSDLGLIVSFHAGWDCYSPDHIHSKPAASRHVIDLFPKLTMVLAHCGGMQCWDDVEKYIVGQDVYLDTGIVASFLEPRQAERILQNHNPERILLGSDCPWEWPKKSIEYILSLDLPETLQKKILSENARRLLKLA